MTKIYRENAMNPFDVQRVIRVEESHILLKLRFTGITIRNG